MDWYAYFGDRVRVHGKCVLWTRALMSTGYGAATFKGKVVLAHRISWTLANGEIPDGLCVLHRCDTRACVRPDHLFLGTKADNNRDKVEKGREYRLIPVERYPEIAQRWADGESQTSIARDFGCDRTAVGWVLRNKIRPELSGAAK